MTDRALGNYSELVPGCGGSDSTSGSCNCELSCNPLSARRDDIDILIGHALHASCLLHM